VDCDKTEESFVQIFSKREVNDQKTKKMILRMV